MKIRKIGLILFSSIMLLSVGCSSVSSDVNNKITVSETKHEIKEIDLNGAEKGVGKINSNGFSINGNKYTNEAYGKSQVSINLRVASGVGNINLELK